MFGAQAQKPLAIVVIGGSLALAILTRLVQPPLLVATQRLGHRLRWRTPGLENGPREPPVYAPGRKFGQNARSAFL